MSKNKITPLVVMYYMMELQKKDENITVSQIGAAMLEEVKSQTKLHKIAIGYYTNPKHLEVFFYQMYLYFGEKPLTNLLVSDKHIRNYKTVVEEGSYSLDYFAKNRAEMDARVKKEDKRREKAYKDKFG